MRLDEIVQPQLKRYRLTLDNLKNGIVLDLGSEANIGEVGLHEFLVKNTKSKVIGVDILHGKNVDITCNLNRKFPFPNNYANTIVCEGTIEHMENPFNFLKECYRTLKPNGRLIVTTDNMFGLHYILSKNWLLPRRYMGNPHLYAWSMELFTNLIEKVGFKVEKKIMLNTFYCRNLLFRLICFYIPRIRPYLFVTARKGGLE